MAISQNPIWQLLLKSMIRVLIGEDKLRFYETIDWQHQSDRLRQADLIYPHYYSGTGSTTLMLKQAFPNSFPPVSVYRMNGGSNCLRFAMRLHWAWHSNPYNPDAWKMASVVNSS